MNWKILMVCHGNICRSPLAKALLIRKLEELKQKDVEVDSAGTSDYHVGQNPDPRTMANAATHGVDLSSYRARQFKSADFDRFDRIYVMDSANYADIMLLANGDMEQQKVRLFLDAAYPGSNDSVPDPWYGDEDGFEKVFHLIDKAAGIIAKEIIKGKLP
jgi:protein-tyrosine phosphatase